MTNRPFTSLAILIFALISVLHLIRACLGWDVSIAGTHIPPVISFGVCSVSGLLALGLWREVGTDALHDAGGTNMADIRVQVPNNFIDPLRATLMLDSYADVVQEALTLLKWAADERKHGRIILSSEPQGENVARLALPSLQRVETTR